MELSERKEKILQAIIDDYIMTAEPVGSAYILASHDLGVSSATVRNEMAALEEAGYLEKPHTSALFLTTPSLSTTIITKLTLSIPISFTEHIIYLDGTGVVKTAV